MTAINLAKTLEQYQLFYLEDPVAPENIDWLKMRRQQSSTPISMGELFVNVNEWKPLIDNKLIDYIRCHVSTIGGITPAKKLAVYSELNDVRTAWHGPGDISPVGVCANCFFSVIQSEPYRVFGRLTLSERRPEMTSKRANRYPPELRERAVRMLLEQRSEYRSEYAAINSIAPKIGCSPDTLRAWLRQHERDNGLGDGRLTSDERQLLKELEQEVRELRRSNDILRQASAYFAKAEFDRLWKK